MFKHPPQKELKEKALVSALKLYTEQATEEPVKCPSSRKKDGGEQGRGWSSWESLEIYQGKETRGYLQTTGVFAPAWSSAASSPRNTATHASS